MHIYPPGTRIGHYEIAGRPLIGGMGIVYLCADHGEQGQPVALKTFKPEYLPDRAARDRFLREGTTWVNLGRHPHIVRCYQVINVGLEVYLVLELVAKEEGRVDASLRSWLVPGKPLPVEQALLFGLQIARGMAHATATIPGFVHRDLKPENVLAGADRLSQANVNRLRVTDFGLAAVLESAGAQRSDGSEMSGASELGRTQLTRGIAGTPLYMAPEQWQGGKLTAQTDVYALGCILHEMLLGQRVLQGDSLAALERAHCEVTLQAPPVGLPSAVGDVVARCLAREPGSRYESWKALETALGMTYAELMGQSVPGPEPVQALNQADRVAAGWSYSAIGNAYLDIGKAQVALGYFEQARQAGWAEREYLLEAAGLNHLGNAHADLGHVRQAIECYEQYLEISRELGDRQREGIALGNLGTAYFELGDARQAVSFYEQQLTIKRESDDRPGEGIALNNLGLAYAALEDLQQAIGCYEEALDIARQTGDRRAEGDALNNLGGAYRNLGHTQRAIECYQKYLEISREIGNRRGEGNALGNLGNAYRQLGDARRAIGYYEQQLVITCEIGDRRGEGNALGALGSAYLELGEARRAIGYFEQAIAIRREIGDLMGVATDSFNMALLHAQQGEPGQALPLAQQAAEIWGRIGNPYAQRAQQLVAQLKATMR